MLRASDHHTDLIIQANRLEKRHEALTQAGAAPWLLAILEESIEAAHDEVFDICDPQKSEAPMT
jgi:hypothetical protein